MGVRRIAWLLITAGVVGLGWHGVTAWAQSQTPLAMVGQAQTALLERAVAASGAKETGALVHDYSVVDGKFYSEAQLESVAIEVGRSLGMANAKQVTRALQNEHFVELSGAGSGQMQVSIYCSSFAGAKAQAATVLVIRVRPRVSQTGSLARAFAEVYTAVAQQHMQPQVSAYVDTVQTGLLSHAQMMKEEAKVLASVHAKAVEMMQSGTDVSVSAYAKQGPPAIKSGKHVMNLQVAVHDDIYHHQTDVMIGTPIIVDPY